MGDMPPRPLWVKVLGIIAFALVLVFIILHFTGNSPGGHNTSIEDGVQQR